MKAHLVAAIAGLAMITMPVLSQTTTPTSTTLSKPGPVAGRNGETLSHDGSANLTNPQAAEASQTTTPTSNTLSKPRPVTANNGETLSHDGSASLTNSQAAEASKSPGAAASPHTGFSAGMVPSAGTGSGTPDGTTDTGATSPSSGRDAARR
jgi:hypothetical protein